MHDLFRSRAASRTKEDSVYEKYSRRRSYSANKISLCEAIENAFE